MKRITLIKKILLITLLTSLTTTGFILINRFSGGTSIQTNNGLMQEITISELSSHNSKNDCWVLLDSKVFDITGYIAKDSNPDYSGSCGKNGTKEILNSTPSNTANKILQKLNNYYIGVIVPS